MMEQFFYEFNIHGIYLKQYIYNIGSYHYNWHRELELLTVLNGKIEVCSQGNSKTLETDDVILLNSNEGHATLAKEPNSIAMVLHIDPDFLKNYYDDIEYLQFNCYSNKKTRYSKPFILIRSHLAEMMQSHREESPELTLLLESSYYSLLYNIVLNFPPNKVENTTFINNNNKFKTINKMVKYIDKNYKEKISLDDLADISGYNRNYVSQLFKSQMGINFHDYITRIRLREATLELGQTDKLISDIALDNGFSDIKAFNKAFKTAFGKTPSEYRDQLNSDIAKADILFKKEFISTDNEYVNKALMQYVINRNSYYSHDELNNVHPYCKDTLESMQLVSDTSIKLKNIANELKDTTDDLEKIIRIMSE